MVTKDPNEVLPTDERKAREDGQTGKFITNSCYDSCSFCFCTRFSPSTYNFYAIKSFNHYEPPSSPFRLSPKSVQKLSDFSSARPPRAQYIKTTVFPQSIAHSRTSTSRLLKSNLLSMGAELTLTRRPSLRGRYMAVDA